MTKLDDRIVDLEREVAELRRQLDESLDQQTATAEVLQVINASPGDLAPVFDAMLDKAMRLCGADLGVFFTFDGTSSHHVAMRGVPDALVEYLREPVPLQTGGPSHD